MNAETVKISMVKRTSNSYGNGADNNVLGGCRVGRFTPQRLPIAAAVVLAIGSMGTVPAIAQKSATDEVTLEEIVVKGYRRSLRSSLDMKRSSAQFVDAISAEGIGVMPDVTITDALVRLPGVFAVIDRGNASLITVRGVGPQLVLGTLNGRELPSSDFDRNLRFEQFPSELLNGAQIHKTQQADIVEGGVAASVNLSTINPLLRNEPSLTAQAAALYYVDEKDIPVTDGQGYRTSISYIDQFADDSIGLAFGYSRQDQPTLLREVENWGYNTVSGGLPGDVNSDGVLDPTPWGGANKSWYGSELRDSALVNLVWAPTDNIEASLDLYYAGLDIDEREQQSWHDGWGNWGGANDGDFSNVVFGPDGYILGGQLNSVASVSQVSAAWVQDQNLYSYAADFVWDVGAWELKSDLSTAVADRFNVWRAVPMHLGGLTGTFDHTGASPHWDYNENIGDASLFSPGDLFFDNYQNLEDEISAFRLDIWRDVDAGVVSRIQFGARVSDREKELDHRNWRQFPTSEIIPNSVVETNYDYPNGQGPELIALNFFAAVDSIYGGFEPISAHPIDPFRSWTVEEKTTAAYLMAEMDGEFGRLPITGNIGLRYYTTDQRSTSRQSVNGVESDVMLGTGYNDLLPSLNVILHPSDEVQVRIAAASAISRAPIDEMRATRSVSNTGGPITVSGGNPLLLPFEADQFDLGVEWYFAPEAYVAITGFYKDVKTYTKLDSFDGVIQGTGDPTLDGQNATFSTVINGEGGYVKGAELIVQSPIGILPPEAGELGIFASYAYSDSNIEESDGLPMSGLARDNVAASLWYHVGGFEARLGYTYNSESVRRITIFGGGLAKQASRDQLDLTTSYSFSDNWQVRLDVTNLTDSDDTLEQLTEPNGLSVLRRQREFGRRLFLGASYRF